MKLAERIAEELNEGNYLVVTGKEPISVDPIGEAESIIATKLEPVKATLLRAIDWINNPPFGEAAHCQMEDSMKEALAMLSEEES